ncbi:DNA-binding MarR family transcriptional regulator [Thermocatellispora tengchongensis]|uniref:DNA-binding MarR family transcriptional regulator n=1 Tax=Thermocatellispora tengchongensis TaxID=1073253 RepID=A0A840PG45_9ACTN|nr:MarR family winged helix-turn-helix transcriptional regulator [Thermocatellispora tengchongensis]MBB5136811.1 DNA-binding MarR family transcriptional regulator [Thermocatellispora tengchongensis]
MPAHYSLSETEEAVKRRLGSIPVRLGPLAAISNLYRAATAVRQHLENSALRTADLTWSAFVVLWVVWIWEEIETRHAAAEAGISKGTLTGIIKTMESRGFIERRQHPGDGRLALLRLTPEGLALMERLFPAFNEEEAFVVGALDEQEAFQLADTLRRIVTRLEDHGEERREAVLSQSPVPPRRSGRRRTR